ncbi:MAG: hypothetical protein JWN30_1289 [Bacilli bacterium]|nr:hypothetical protein [Bacilli bacterium]
MVFKNSEKWFPIKGDHFFLSIELNCPLIQIVFSAAGRPPPAAGAPHFAAYLGLRIKVISLSPISSFYQFSKLAPIRQSPLSDK